MFKIILALLAANIVLGGSFVYQVSQATKTGPEAVTALKEDEKPYLAKFKQLHSGMSFEKTKQVFGTPFEVKNTEIKGVFVLLATWRINGNRTNMIQLFFANDRLIKGRWTHMGYFIIEL